MSALPPPSASSPPGPSRGLSRRAAVALAGSLVVTGAVGAGGWWWLTRDGGPGSGDVVLEAVDDPGQSPFTDSVASEVSFSDEARAYVDDLALSAEVEGSTPGLYGGTNDVGSCDKEALVDFLDADDDKREAWAGALDVDEGDVADYVGTLAAVALTRDTAVVNHGYEDGRATPYDAVLQAGSAVLVDAAGTPVVRCACGNPLGTLDRDVTVPDSPDGAWKGYAPKRVVSVRPAPEPVSTLTYVDVDSGEQAIAPVGDGSGDYIAWASSYGSDYKPVAQIWNGEEIVTTQGNPRDNGSDTLTPIGFIGETAYFKDAGGAHGHSWMLYGYDVNDGSLVASADCSVCDDAQVAGSEVVFFEYGEDHLQVRRLDADLDEVDAVDFPEEEGHFQEVEFGEAPPPAYLRDASEDAAYLLVMTTDWTGEEGEIPGYRLIRLGNDGEVTRSEDFSMEQQAIFGGQAVDLSPDGTTLAVVTASGEIALLDAETMEQTGEIPAADDGSRIRSMSLRDDGTLDATVNDCSDFYCDTSHLAATNTSWDGDGWTVADETPVVCATASGRTRVTTTGEQVEDDSYSTLLRQSVEVLGADGYEEADEVIGASCLGA
ncbi:MAG: hypothetical protein QM621_10135 [Aeromicrobium sp.]|uniref:DUF6777 domain-containing protein n=1 Tax=Aeromicrobium sp. TaxID=1871063 RepID=UPI0039E6B473